MPKIFSRNFSQLYTGDHLFMIPPYQRSITWPRDQWDYLYQDIVDIAESETDYNHLFQIFQFKRTETDTGSVYEVGDGQQRLVHTSLFLAGLAYALREILNDKNIPEIEAEKIRQLIRSIIGSLNEDTDSLAINSLLAAKFVKILVPRITLNKETHQIYSKIIHWDMNSLNEPQQKHLLCLAFNHYKQKLYARLSPLNYELIFSGAQQIVETVTTKIVFAAAYFESSEDMQSSYEATNSRGIALTESELIKNHIFKGFSLEQQIARADAWKPLEGSYWVNKDEIYKKVSGQNASGAPRKDKLDVLFHIHNKAVSKGKMGEYGISNYAIFHNFKRHHDLAIKNSGKKFDSGSYYINLIDEFVLLSRVYRNISEGKYKVLPDYNGNNNETKENRYITSYSRLVAGCGVSSQDFFTLVFILEMKSHGMTGWKDSKIVAKDKYATASVVIEFLKIIESYIIRKVLTGGTTNDPFNKVIEAFFDYPNLSPDGLKKLLLMQQGKRTSWEGDKDILEYQKTHTMSKEMLAKNLNFDYSKISQDGIDNVVILYINKETLEHFMPQSSMNYERDWPLPDNQTHYRDSLIYNFGNYVQISGPLNNKLSNQSYSKKKEIITEYYSDKATNKTIDRVINSEKWDKEEINNHLEEKLNLLLKYYAGPSTTVKSYPLSIPVSLGKLSYGDKISCHTKGGDVIDLEVSNEGKILYKGIEYETEREIKNAIMADLNRTDSLKLLIHDGQRAISIRSYITKLATEIEA